MCTAQPCPLLLGSWYPSIESYPDHVLYPSRFFEGFGWIPTMWIYRRGHFVHMFCWDHSVYASFPLSCFGCSVVWIAHVKLDLSLRWSLALTCWRLLGLGLVLVRTLPSIFGGELSTFFSIEFFTEAFPFGFFFLPCCLLELFSFGIYCSFELSVWVWSSSSFLTVSLWSTFYCPRFLDLTIPPWWLLLAFPWLLALCVGFRFDTLSEPDFS